MSEIQNLFSKKDGLLIQIACIVADLKKYIDSPVGSVSVEDLHYQFDFIVFEIQKIDNRISFLFTQQRTFLISQNSDLKKLTEKATSSIVFTVNDVPKLHFSMFDDSNF